jgi:protoporphyrinogen oxidase
VPSKTICLGAGMTGLAASFAGNLPCFEAQDSPGGISSSYVKDGYVFCTGGGHWIFNLSGPVLHFLSRFCTFKTYERKASVFFADTGEFVRYPIQDAYPNEVARLDRPATTMKEWLTHKFSDRLCERFFYPFHDKYLAGMTERVAPQDGYKTPGNGRGYNATFRYPVEGLDVLACGIAEKCGLHYDSKITKIWPEPDGLRFTLNNKRQEAVTQLISTLPLNKMMELTGLSVDAEPDPYTSCLVLNIGAKRGPRCPDDHWCYIPQSQSGFHRVGFYSNVDQSFLPKGATDRVSLYVERAFVGGQGGSWCYNDVFNELKDWGWIDDPDVLDMTQVDVAYTWRWPGSTWREQALAKLEEHGIYQTGRYGKWQFQGIADSVRDGLMVGAAFRE